MELKHLIVSYRYLKFFVEAFEQSNEALQKKSLIIGLILIPNKKWTAFAVYLRPSQIVCKPPVWCRIEAPYWRF